MQQKIPFYKNIIQIALSVFVKACCLVVSMSSIISAQEVAQTELVKEKELTPSDIVFNAHIKLKAAEAAKEKEDYKAAWNNYASALKYYQNLRMTQPLWKPSVVTFRIQQTGKLLQEIKPKLDAQLKKEQAAAEGIISGTEKFDTSKPDLSLPPELLKITNKITLLRSDLEKNKKRYERDRTEQEAHLQTAEGQLKIWAKDNKSNPEQIAKLEKEIERTKAILENSRHFEKADQDKISNHISSLEKNLAKHSAAPLREELERSEKELKKRNEELKIVSLSLLEWKNEAAFHKKQAADKTAELNKAQAEIDKLNAQMNSQAASSGKVVKALYERLETSESKRKQLSNELKDVKVALADLTEKFDQQFQQNKELQAQLDSVSEERDRLNALILENPDERIRSFAKQNIDLMQELRDTRETLSRVVKDQNGNIERMQKAENDLAIAKKRILDFQDRKIKDDQRMLALKNQLAEIQTSTTQNLSNKSLSPVEREENLILRATAKKYQMREAFLRDKWELLKRHILQKNDDPEAIALVQNSLTEESLELTEKEKRIIAKQEQADAVFSRNTSVSEAQAESTIARSERDVETIHSVVAKLLQRNRLGAAKSLLEEANTILPNNFPTLVNLGTVSMKMGDLNMAEQHFKDGVVMKRNNPFVHYKLGLCQLRMEKDDLAQKSLEFSLDLDGNQEKVAYYLGVVAGKGSRLNEAEDHFEQAIRINPNFSEAYFALSLNHLFKKQLKEAQDYYQKALEKGYSPDATHAKKLGLTQ